MNKIALVNGVSGQDGTYLAELLIEKGYRVIGAVRDVVSVTKKSDNYLSDKMRGHLWMGHCIEIW